MYNRLLATDLEFLGDRDADLWIPLFAICSLSAHDRLAELKKCAVALKAEPRRGTIQMIRCRSRC